MSEHGGAREGAGRRSLEDIYGERIIEFTARMPESHYQHISSQGVSAAAYIRHLIEADLDAYRAQRRPPGRPRNPD